MARDTRPRTLLVKDISYNTRYDVIDHVPGGEELRMCLLTKTSLGRFNHLCILQLSSSSHLPSRAYCQALVVFHQELTQ